MSNTFLFKTLEELTVNDSDAETLLLYGPAGSGKTYFCGTGEDRVLFINIGSGEKTLRSPLYKARFPKAGQMLTVNLIPELTANGMPKDWTVFDKVTDVIDEALAKHSDRFDTVVVDDGSTLHKIAIMKAIETNSAAGLSNTKTSPAQTKYKLIRAALQDYQTEMNIIDQFMAGTTTLCKKHNKHFIITAHDRLTFKKGDKMGDMPVLIRTTPAFTGVDKSPDSIIQYFDNVWHTEAVGGGSDRLYRITTQGHEQLAGKTRMAGVFETVEKNLTWPKALERIKNADPTKLKGVR